METAIPHKAEVFYYKQAADAFLSVRGSAHDSPFMQYCAPALLELAENSGHYKSTTIVAKNFLEELFTEIHLCGDRENTPLSRLEDRAFTIFECLALIFRESRLREPARQPSSAQVELLRYFEECGEWVKGDGKLVTEYYYFFLPQAIGVT